MNISLKSASKLFLLVGISFFIYLVILSNTKDSSFSLWIFIATSTFFMFAISIAFFISHIHHKEEVAKLEIKRLKERELFAENYDKPVKMGIRLYGLKAPRGYFYGTLVGILRNGDMRPYQTIFDKISRPFLHIRLYDEKKEVDGFKLGAPFFKKRRDGKIEMLNNIYDVQPFSEGVNTKV